MGSITTHSHPCRPLTFPADDQHPRISEQPPIFLWINRKSFEQPWDYTLDIQDILYPHGGLNVFRPSKYGYSDIRSSTPEGETLLTPRISQLHVEPRMTADTSPEGPHRSIRPLTIQPHKDVMVNPQEVQAYRPVRADISTTADPSPTVTFSQPYPLGIVEVVHRGKNWTVCLGYYGKQPVCVKIASELDQTENEQCLHGHHIARVVRDEHDLYTGVLKELQGDVIPVYYGTWEAQRTYKSGAEFRYYIQVSEWVGYPSDDECFVGFSESERERIKDLYDAVFDKRLSFWDTQTEARQILLPEEADRRLCLTGFADCSIVEEHEKDIPESQRRLVHLYLGYLTVEQYRSFDHAS